MKKRCMAAVLLLTGVCALTACGNSNSNTDTETVQNIENVRVTYELPEGFTESETAGMYYGPDYPSDASNVYVIETEKDTISLSLTQDDLCEMVENAYQSQFNVEVDVNCSEFTKTTIDGFDALIVRMNYEFNNVAIEQSETVIQIGEGTTTITCTQQSGADWNEAFDAVMASVHVVTE